MVEQIARRLPTPRLQARRGLETMERAQPFSRSACGARPVPSSTPPQPSSNSANAPVFETSPHPAASSPALDKTAPTNRRSPRSFQAEPPDPASPVAAIAPPHPRARYSNQPPPGQTSPRIPAAAPPPAPPPPPCTPPPLFDAARAPAIPGSPGHSRPPAPAARRAH
jgi:hypothetical protein